MLEWLWGRIHKVLSRYNYGTTIPIETGKHYCIYQLVKA